MKLNFTNYLSNILVFYEIIQSKTVINEENSMLNFRNFTIKLNQKKLFSILALLIVQKTSYHCQEPISKTKLSFKPKIQFSLMTFLRSSLH